VKQRIRAGCVTLPEAKKIIFFVIYCFAINRQKSAISCSDVYDTYEAYNYEE